MSADFRRLRPRRATLELRDQYAEARLAVDHFILPFFVVEGHGVETPLPTLPAVSHLSVDRLVAAVRRAAGAGVRRVLLFGVVDDPLKDALASAARRDDALVARAVSAVKNALPDTEVFTDVCLCAYTDHGHCGLLNGREVDNDATLPLLADMALVHARAGADWVAPSAMMDGQVAAIRDRLDQEGFVRTRVLGYSAKYASRLYGPFRDAARSAPAFGDRRTYQMDPRCGSQAEDEVAADLDEGAAAVMVKPAAWYLDILGRVRHRFPAARLVAYHTSGETMMIRHAAAAGLFPWRDALLEALTAIRRAGADSIITYDAVEVAGWLADGA